MSACRGWDAKCAAPALWKPNPAWHCVNAVKNNALAAMQAFDEWMEILELELQDLCELSSDELPRCPYREWEAIGMSPGEAAEAALENSLGEPN